MSHQSHEFRNQNRDVDLLNAKDVKMKSLIGRNGIVNEFAIVITALGLVCHDVGRTAAQNVIGSNASPCPGTCAPGTPYGFFKPHWRQWPGAVYPDTMIPKPATGEIPP